MASSAAVLAGGRSRRMGRDKAMLSLGGTTLLERTISLLFGLTDDVFIVGHTHSMPSHRSLRCHEDLAPDCGPLGGIATALRTAAYEHVIIVACDLPFLNAGLLEHLVALSPGYEAAVPRLQGRPQPVHSVYNKRARTKVEAHLKAGRYSLHELLSTLHVRWVVESEMHSLDPGHKSFRNVNTIEDWEAAQREIHTSPWSAEPHDAPEKTRVE